MPLWLQHLLTLSLVAGCVAIIVRQLVKTFRTGRGIGSCCGKGCSPAREQTGSAVFISSDTVRVRRPPVR